MNPNRNHSEMEEALKHTTAGQFNELGKAVSDMAITTTTAPSTPAEGSFFVIVPCDFSQGSPSIQAIHLLPAVELLLIIIYALFPTVHINMHRILA